jgi:hypothetical protein
MKTLIAMLALSMFFAIGCKGGDGEVTVKKGAEKKAPSGETLWAKACDHAIEMMKKSDLMSDIPKEELDKALDGASRECLEEFKDVGGTDADEAANCVLALNTFDHEKFSECEPKKWAEKKEEKKEEKK